MKKLIGLASFMGLFLLVAGLAFAHGGNYSGPGGGGTGPGFTPGGGGTPGSGGGPGGGGTGGGGTSGGGGGTSGGGGSGGGPGAGPSRPGGGPGGGFGGGGGAGGVSSTKKGGGSGQGTSWDSWWFFNDDKFLNLKAKVRADEAETDNADIFMGEGPAGGDVITRVPAKKIREQVIPVLKQGVKDPYYDTRAAAVIALGKCGTPDVLAEISSTIADEDKRVRESSCLAMGILGNKDAIKSLVDIMADSKAARKLLSRDKEILSRTRAFAALGIGLIGSREDISDTQGVSALRDMLKQKVKNVDLHVGPLTALGIMKSQESVPAVIEYLKDLDNSPISRCHAAIALGKIGDQSAIPVLLKSLKDKHNQVSQSAAIALGILADESNADVSKSLLKTAKSAADRGVRNFAIMALAEIGGEKNRNDLVKLLKSKNRMDKTFAAIGLGVYGYKNEDIEESNIASLMLDAFKKVKNHEERGAYAVAMGLLKYEKAGPELLKALEKGGQAAFRGHLCTSLGLMGFKPSIKLIQEVVKERGDIDLRRNAAIALGLLGDKSAVSVLEEEIKNSENSLAVHGAVTQGLGFIGDISAVPTLNDMVRNRKDYKDGTRAFAAVALGLIGDKDNIPVMFSISENNNYLSRTEALAEVLTIL